MSGWEWARFRTAARVRAAGARLVLGGMCWPSMPLNWPGPLRLWATASTRSGAARRRAARPGRAPCGAPVAHASHVGPVRGETPLGPGIPWQTQMLGESQICDRDGTVLARLTLEDGEGHVAANVALEAPAPLDAIEDRFWIPEMTLTTNARLARDERPRRPQLQAPPRAQGLRLAAWPAGDLPDEVPPASAGDAPFATSSKRPAAW